MKSALVCLAALGLAAAPVAADAEDISVEYADLDLSTEAGVKQLERRIDAAARAACAADSPITGSRMVSTKAKRCVAEAKAAAMEQFAAVIERQRLGG